MDKTTGVQQVTVNPIYLFHFVYILCFGMILNNLATLCDNEYVTKPHHANTQSHFLIISCVQCDVDNGKYEQLFH
jgi:hypothetical protein